MVLITFVFTSFEVLNQYCSNRYLLEEEEKDILLNILREVFSYYITQMRLKKLLKENICYKEGFKFIP